MYPLFLPPVISRFLNLFFRSDIKKQEKRLRHQSVQNLFSVISVFPKEQDNVLENGQGLRQMENFFDDVTDAALIAMLINCDIFCISIDAMICLQVIPHSIGQSLINHPLKAFLLSHFFPGAAGDAPELIKGKFFAGIEAVDHLGSLFFGSGSFQFFEILFFYTFVLLSVHMITEITTLKHGLVNV